MCRLGEVKDEPRYYEKSWELSNHHYARAKRDWGDYLYKQMKYEECIPHYKQAVMNMNECIMSSLISICYIQIVGSS